MQPPYVFGIGFKKTGSTSLCVALNLLGIPSLHCYSHRGSKLKVHVRLNNKRNKKLFDSYSLDQLYRGFFDFRGDLAYKTLYIQYPNSRFIFHTRQIDDWLASVSYLLKSRPAMQNKMSHDQLIKQYYDTSKEIRRFFSDKQDQFLEIDICAGAGWEPLCKFLEVPVPSETFPHANKTRYVHKK